MPRTRENALDIVGTRLRRKMILPGLVSIAFYRKRPTWAQIGLGLVFTIVVSGLIGYLQFYGTSRAWENAFVAIFGGVVLYAAILFYLVYFYIPKMEHVHAPPSRSAPPP